MLQEDGGRGRMEPPGDSAVSRLQRVTFATLLLLSTKVGILFFGHIN
jgi:hypothetical protein